MAESHKVIVHHLNDSRSQRVLWLLEELEVPYEIKKYQRTADHVAPKELKAVHPLGLSPVITDGDVVLAESGAIAEYLIEKYGNGRFTPPESGRIDELYYKHYAEGTIMPLLVNQLIFTLAPQRAPFYIRPVLNMVFGMLMSQMIYPRIKLHMEMIEKHLAARPGKFISGGDIPTAADFQMIFPLEAYVARTESEVGEHIQAYVKAIHERPAYKRASKGLEKGGKYSYAAGL
ncbi:glutathione S-transferase [Ceratobasidium sp. AG-Ba]|nr:glutathione S-transferase [Ceratobasidium sp. AG-Ba]QRW10951.1 glutathione S-transferase [Ceratobasidium sp. AG-Ba]